MKTTKTAPLKKSDVLKLAYDQALPPALVERLRRERDELVAASAALPRRHPRQGSLGYNHAWRDRAIQLSWSLPWADRLRDEPEVSAEDARI